LTKVEVRASKGLKTLNPVNYTLANYNFMLLSKRNPILSIHTYVHHGSDSLRKSFPLKS